MPKPEEFAHFPYRGALFNLDDGLSGGDLVGTHSMWRLLDSISYSVLIFIAAFMLLAPFSPMPHIVEKIIMLKNGNLTRAVDIFDLCFHLAPSVLLAAKFFRDRNQK